MSKTRIQVEWFYGIAKSIFKLVDKYLFCKLDQNMDLHAQHLRVSHLFSNFCACYRGNSLSDAVSFSTPPPTIDDHINSNNA